MTFSDLNYPDQSHTQAAMDALYRLALQMNFRVMLSGEGAENFVLGYRVVLDSILRHFKLGEVYRRLRTMYAETSLRNCVAQVMRFGLVPLLPEPISRGFYYKWMRPALCRPDVPYWLTPSFQVRIRQQVARQREQLMRLPRPKDWAKRIEVETLSPSNPAVGIAFPSLIERRFPYLDRRLMEFCLAIPPEHKYQCHKGGMRRRALQRQTMAGIIPEPIRQCQRKTYFSDVGARRYRVHKDAYFQILAPASTPLVARLGYIDETKFRQLLSTAYRRLDENVVPDGRLSVELFWIHRVLLLEIWLLGIERYSSPCAPNEYSNLRKGETSNLELSR